MTSSPTIAAISTPQGKGAISVVRMSGGDSRKILSDCWLGTSPSSFNPREAYFGKITSNTGSVLDEVLATWFQGPHSYTGEDTVELSCHGGILVVRRVLERLYACGATPAEPGEFTQRAFLNGKMDLTQAEAVMDILSAQSDLALKAAQEQLSGSLGTQIKEQTDRVLHILAHIEAHIDFPDEDITPEATQALLDQCATISNAIESLLGTADRGRLLRNGVRTVLAGAPNVGKSSLLNLLLGYERAIVSDTPGTTRDTLEETINVEGFALRLIDTAGIRNSDDQIEQAGIRRTTEALDQADLVLEVVDASAPPSQHSVKTVNTHHILLLNKCDLGIHPDWQNTPGIPFSCKTGQGEQALNAAISSLLVSDTLPDRQSALIAINARHQHCLKLANESLNNAMEGLQAAISPEFIALDIREALNHLGEVTGKVDTEDVLGQIFSTFCIGK